MKVEFHYIPEFERRAKALAKKYKSFPKDYDDFLDSLEKNPFQGTSLGGGVYTLLCTFNDGVKKKVDLQPLLKYPAFKDLEDKQKFVQFGLDHTIFWANGADIAPEYLYDHGDSLLICLASPFNSIWRLNCFLFLSFSEGSRHSGLFAGARFAA